ncbi:MAG TPA: lyase family protein [Jatrophihabitantaceae bacterium]|jgi:3-carboxy-cis,cis-muconate cycloisomerase
MSDLLRPGGERADGVFDDAALLTALVAVEQAWLHALAAGRIAPTTRSIGSLVGPDDLASLSSGAESGGNPVIPLVRLLRERLGDDPAGTWLHRGLTSQDVLDTALVLCAAAALDRVVADLHRQVQRLIVLIDAHGATGQAGRTLTQPAVPITFALKAAAWLAGVLDAGDDLTAVRSELPVQVGGAAGTMAATVELARIAGRPDPVAAALAAADAFAAELGLVARPPWHTNRRPLTRAGDALVAATDAFGHIANDVATLSRPEIGELSEGVGGGSSTMPHKQNPVLSVLVRRAAREAPLLGAQLHLAAAEAVDERPAGAWHLEWPAVRTLARVAVTAAGQTADLLAGLVVHPERMAGHLGADLLAERDAIRQALGAAPDGGNDPASYLGAAAEFVRAQRERAEQVRV